MSETDPTIVPEPGLPPEEKAHPASSAPKKKTAATKPSTASRSGRTARPVKNPHAGTWNLLTALLLAGTFFVASLYVLIYTRPELLAEHTPLGFLIARTPTPLQITFAPQPSPTLTPEPPTPQPATPDPSNATPQFTSTATLQAVEATPLDPNATPNAGTPEVNSLYAFAVQGQVNAIDGTVIDQNHGCNWMGVAGRIQDADGSPITGIQVHLVGYIGGRTRDLLTLSGTGQAFGPGGYEFTLGSQPLGTVDSVWIQLVEQNGLPLSARVRFSTYEDCSRNLIVINFVKVR